MKKIIMLVGIWLAAGLPAFGGLPNGDAQISGGAGDSKIIITTTDRLAGAIGSLKWHGKEFINSFDHGRNLQSACSFDDTPKVGAESFNPTEGGSRDDFTGARSTSRLLKITARGNHLFTRTQMAFWLAPGERSGGELARNTNALSDYFLTKKVTIGFKRWPQALDYRVTFTIPRGAKLASAQYEAVTGYMPLNFDHFWHYDAASGTLQPLSHGPGRFEGPVVLATADGQYAMGVFGLPQTRRDTTGPVYGRWYIKEAQVVKWTCVYRVSNPHGIRAGDYSYRMLVPVGTLAQVGAMLRDWEKMKW